MEAVAQKPSTRFHEISKPGEMLWERFAVDSVPAERLPALLDNSRKGTPRRGRAEAFLARIKGPGGYYNIGNSLALSTGLGIQLAAASDAGDSGHGALLAAAQEYFVGSPEAAALTISMVMFFASGEMYHRAWSRGFPPDLRCNRWGDLLSGVGAVVLTVALAAYSEVLLAVTSGILLAGGKFGSAMVPETYGAGSQPSPWPNRFRTAVLLSRVPALAALALELIGLLAASAAPARLVMTAVMLFCYVLWTCADFMLVAGAGSQRKNAPRHPNNEIPKR
jgi:hypothetical protein